MAQTLSEQHQKIIRKELGSLECPEHHRNPVKLTFTPNGLEFESCCHNFKDRMITEHKRLVFELTGTPIPKRNK
jgi:hypothetical protein